MNTNTSIWLFLWTGERDVDVLRQHRMCHHVRHWTCHRSQWVWPTCAYLHTLQLQHAEVLKCCLGGTRRVIMFFCKLALGCLRHKLCRGDAQRVMVYCERFGCGQPHRVLFRSHSQRGNHRDVQAVSPALRLHGWRLRPLAVQLHCRPRFPFHGGQFTHNSLGATVCYSNCNQLQRLLTACTERQTTELLWISCTLWSLWSVNTMPRWEGISSDLGEVNIVTNQSRKSQWWFLNNLEWESLSANEKHLRQQPIFSGRNVPGHLAPGSDRAILREITKNQKNNLWLRVLDSFWSSIWDELDIFLIWLHHKQASKNVADVSQVWKCIQ